MRRLLSSPDHELGRYSVFAPPTNISEWVTTPPVMNKQLYTIDGEPVIFRIVGVVTNRGAELVSPDGLAKRLASLLLYPVRDSEYDAWRALLLRLGGIQSTYCVLSFCDSSYTTTVPYGPEENALTARRRMVFKRGPFLMVCWHGIVLCIFLYLRSAS